MEQKSPGLDALDQFAESLLEGQAAVPPVSTSPQRPTASSGSSGARLDRTGPYQSWVGKRLGNFRIMKVIGAGTMGVVLQVEDQNLKRIAALKVLLKQEKGTAKAQQIERFLLEAQSAASIDHPCIAQVFEINQHQGRWYIIMEFMEGGSIVDLIRSTGPIPPGRAALLYADAARGLAAAHEMGVIHRDIKPANLMLTRRGRCKIVDFGLAKLDSVQHPFAQDDQLLVGTPDYVAPELAHRKGASSSSDIYSLGASLYASLTGEPPFRGKSIQEILQKHIVEKPPDVRKKVPNCPPAVAELILNSLAKNPADRPNAEAFAAVLQTEVAAALATDSPSTMPAGRSGSSSAGSMSRSLNTAAGLEAGGGGGGLWLKISGLAAAAIAVMAISIWAILHYANQAENVNAAAPIQQMPVARGPDSGANPPGAAPAPIVPVPGSTITNSVGMQLAPIPAGVFQMGSPPDEVGRDVDERQFKVTLTKGFHIGVTPVTQKQWAQVMGAHYVSSDGVHPDELMGEHFTGDNFPINCVSWNEAEEFCRRLGAKENRNYQLPTEAQWECACRAGTSTPFNFGSKLTAELANIDPQSPYGAPAPSTEKDDPMRPMPVGSFPPNAFGLYDMHGNVMQWCRDWYGDYPLGSATDPTGPETGEARVVRGGSWLHAAVIARSASRWSYPPVVRTNYIGFRVVLEDAPK
jgi:formylglycine-generating enzyme required for sulfatase activity